MPSNYRDFTITFINTHTFGRIPLDEGSARRRDLYLTHNTHKRQTSMPPVEFEHAKPASERPHTRAQDRATTGICNEKYYHSKIQHTMHNQRTFMKTKWKITGWGLARFPKSPLTSCQVRYEGDMSDHMFSISDYFPSVTVQPLDVLKNCTLCIKSWSNLEPLIYWKGRTITSSACPVVSACVMNVVPQDAASWAWIWPLTSISCWS